MTLPTAADWFRATPLSPGLTLIEEPHVHPLFQANMYLVEGGDRDVIVDTGMGIAPLRPFVDGIRDAAKPILCVSTHAHIDHIGGAWEFEDRLIHAAEAEDQAAPRPGSLLKSGYAPATLARYEAAGYPPLWDVIIDAAPHDGYDPAAFAQRPAPASGRVAEGDVIDLGGREFEALHLPGHSPGGIGLLDRADGMLIAGDAIYDGPLIYEGPGTDIAAYRATLARLAGLPLRVIHGGHDKAFGPARLAEIVERHLALWGEA